MSPVSPVMEARSNLLSIMPRIMACMATLWKAVSHDGIPAVTTTSRSQAHNGFYKLVMGDPKVDMQGRQFPMQFSFSLMYAFSLWACVWRSLWGVGVGRESCWRNKATPFQSRLKTVACLCGKLQVVRQYILELLSPISLLHGSHLLGAFAVAWNDRRQKIVGQSRKVS